MVGEDLVLMERNLKSYQSVDPCTTLLEFLRSNTRFKSVKLSCVESGCGACIVILSKYDPVLDQVEEYSINSCLTLLCNTNGCSITTSDGLGNTKKGSTQFTRDLQGSMPLNVVYVPQGCVSLSIRLFQAPKTHNLLLNTSVSATEKSFAGNLCRCTRYRPIADACKSFAGDVDIED